MTIPHDVRKTILDCLKWQERRAASLGDAGRDLDADDMYAGIAAARAWLDSQPCRVPVADIGEMVSLAMAMAAILAHGGSDMNAEISAINRVIAWLNGQNEEPQP